MFAKEFYRGFPHSIKIIRNNNPNKTGVNRTKLKLCSRVQFDKFELTGARSPQFYSIQLNLPNNHSNNILIVTKNKNKTILTINPLDHITKGVTDIIINSKSKIRKIIQNTKKRKETGNTLTLKESNPHSNLSALINFELIKNLPKPITAGIIIEINKYLNKTHINDLINK